ncbi:hypothetical protein ELP28_28470 [Klebsiella pneumoniae]|nr:hypothetical protein [Klebsiella pneumoniae]
MLLFLVRCQCSAFRSGSSSTRWPTYQAPAAARPGGQVQIWTPEGNQPESKRNSQPQKIEN